MVDPVWAGALSGNSMKKLVPALTSAKIFLRYCVSNSAAERNQYPLRIDCIFASILINIQSRVSRPHLLIRRLLIKTKAATIYGYAGLCIAKCLDLKCLLGYFPIACHNSSFGPAVVTNSIIEP